MMETLSEFLRMGGYAFYVWSAYGLAFVVLLANFVAPVARARRVKRELARRARLARSEA